MGTRSLTRVWEVYGNDKRCVLAMYRQFDGYLSGHGKDLKEFLKDMQICNGISEKQQKGKWANGGGCLAAQLVKQLKDGIGGIYLTTQDNEQEYNYDIYIEEGGSKPIRIKVESYGKVLHDGDVKSMPTKDGAGE